MLWALTLLLTSSGAHAWEQCFQDAAAKHRVNPLVLRAIAQVESGENPNAHNRNTNGTRDIGMMQINSSWLPMLSKHGVREQELKDPCVSIHVGAWILSKAIERHGNTWRGVAAYHSATPTYNRRYAWKVYHALKSIMAANSDPQGESVKNASTSLRCGRSSPLQPKNVNESSRSNRDDGCA